MESTKTLCPRCSKKKLRLESGYWFCDACGLRRRPEDRQIMRLESNYVVLQRNLDRAPPGSEVELVDCGQKLQGTMGVFKNGRVTKALRTTSGFVVAFSDDIEDFALLIVEREWYIAGPEAILVAIDLLRV